MEGTGDIKTRETRRTIIRGWMAPTTDKQETDERMQDRQRFLLRPDDILSRIRLLRPFGEGARSPSVRTRNSRSFLQASGSVPDHQIVLQRNRLLSNSLLCL